MSPNFVRDIRRVKKLDFIPMLYDQAFMAMQKEELKEALMQKRFQDMLHKTDYAKFHPFINSVFD